MSGWENLLKDALILDSEYVTLPPVKLEDVIFKEYHLDGSTDPMPLHDELESEFLNQGMDKKCAGNYAFAIIEAIQNAQQHAYNWKKTDSEGNLNKILVNCIYAPKYDVVGVSSKGTIDVEKIKDLIKENESVRYALRGRGFYTMTKICNVVYPHQENGNLELLLVMLKKGELIIRPEAEKSAA